MRCLYCSAKVELLETTCYCKECSTYFKVANGELDPIFLKSTEVYREYVKLDEKPLLCAVCQEKEEREYHRTRAEEEHRLEIVGRAQDSARLCSSKHSFCKQCADSINRKLKEDEARWLPAYHQFLRRQRVMHSGVFLLSLALAWAELSALSLVLGLGWDLWQSRPEKKLWRLIGFSLLFLAAPKTVYLYLGCLLWSAWRKYWGKEWRYLDCAVDVERLQEEVQRGLTRVAIGEKARKKEPRSFVHQVYVSSLKANEEIGALCRQLEGVTIKGKWYDKIDRVVEWMIAGN